MQANESGGRLDHDDPLTKPYLAKAEKDRKKRKEPRRLAYRLSDFLSPTARYAPMLERLETRDEAVNPYESVSKVVLAEVMAGLESGNLPSWFSATLDMQSLKEALQG